MAEHTNEPVTYYANMVTMNLNVDEMAMEFRRYHPPHTPQGAPSITADDIYRIEPMVRVVVTFSAAKTMRDFLSQVVPQIEEMRKTQ